MSEPTYEIVFRGKLLRDFERATVVNNLMQLFRIDAARVEAMLGQTKLVLKRGLSKDAATRYQEVLRQAGVMVAAVAETGAASPVVGSPAPAAVAPMTSAAAAQASAAAPSIPIAPAPASTAAPSANSSLTLAAVGTPVLEAQTRPAARNYDLSAFTLDAPGATLVEKRPVPARRFDTSLLALEAVPVDVEAETPPSELTRKLFGD